jgi:hypothetical protein
MEEVKENEIKNVRVKEYIAKELHRGRGKTGSQEGN